MYLKGIGDLYQADLIDLLNIAHYNDSYLYLLTCIDVFTKKAWEIPLRMKSVRQMTEAFKKIVNRATGGRQYCRLTTNVGNKQHSFLFFTKRRYQSESGGAF